VDPDEEASPDFVLRAGLCLDLVDISAADALAAARLPRVVRPGAGRDDHGRCNGWTVGLESVAQTHCASACRGTWSRLPTLLSIATAALHYLFGGSAFAQLGRLSIFDFVVFVLVVGEELGWRGYALPKLLERWSPLTSSLILGLLWGLWHLPTFLVLGTPQYGLPLSAFILLTIEYSILLTWLYLHTKGSVLLATLCHGAINLSQSLFLGGIEGATRYWLLTITYGVAALVLAIVLRLSSLREPVPPVVRAPADTREA
jgi:membrane protease YdiL (CAAX protease family)